MLPNIILSHLPAPSTTMVDVECSTKLHLLNGDKEIQCLSIDTYLWVVKPVCVCFQVGLQLGLYLQVFVQL